MKMKAAQFRTVGTERSVIPSPRPRDWHTLRAHEDGPTANPGAAKSYKIVSVVVRSQLGYSFHLKAINDKGEPYVFTAGHKQHSVPGSLESGRMRC